MKWQYPKNNLIQLNLRKKQVTIIGQVATNNYDYALSPDGAKVAFNLVSQKQDIDGIRSVEYDYFELWLANSDGSEKKMIDTGRWPVFSNDGRHIAFYRAYYDSDF